MRLATVAVLVPDYEEGIAFFTEALGFTLLEDTAQDEAKRWVRLGAPGGASEVLLARAATPGQQAVLGNQHGGRVGFFLETDDFAASHARMQGWGVTFEEVPRHEPYGTVAVFRDPWGNRWDLIERA
jgi:catechol 2,3-dioxygenase-like lactoylglutathione lyase family enzyme